MSVALSRHSFRVGLYLEHLEEMSFLFDQLRSLRAARDIPWTRARDFEERLEAHTDALVVGGQLALDVAAERAISGDSGELFAAICAFCRLRQASLVSAVFQSLDYEASERTQALGDALKYEMPDEWFNYCARAVVSGDRRLVPTLAEVLGYRRLATDDLLLQSLQSAAPAALPRLLWSIGRCGGAASLPMVRSLSESAHQATAAAAVHAALRLGDGELLNRLGGTDSPVWCEAIGLALARGRRAAAVLVNSVDESTSSHDSVMALGLLGDLSAVGPLVKWLSVEPLSESAAEALHVITGAPLMDEILIEDPVTRDELFDKEMRTYRETGELPRRGDGERFGSRVRRLSLDPAMWQDWIESNRARFVPGVRYRCGLPDSPRVLLDCLRSETFPKSYRPWVAEELLIRYGIDLPFEADMFVAEQRRVLDAAAARIDAATDIFEPGQWYFAGQLIS